MHCVFVHTLRFLHFHLILSYFALTSRYSIATCIYILTRRSCLVLLIVNFSQINIGFLGRYLEFQSKL